MSTNSESSKTIFQVSDDTSSFPSSIQELQDIYTSKTPMKDQYLSELNAFLERQPCHVRELYQVGIDIDGDESEDSTNLSPDQIREEVRFIILTQRRKEALARYETFANPNGDMWNADIGNGIIEQIEFAVKDCLDKKGFPKKFNHLFALTASLTENAESWLFHNEMGGEGFKLETSIEALGNAWKFLLSHKSKKLNIDSKYTRPGIESLLEQFKIQIDSEYEMGDKIETPNLFQWKP